MLSLSTPAEVTTRRWRRARAAGGFTLVEILVSVAISGFIMTAVLSAMLFMNRTGFRASAYSELDTELRRALETFGQDARVAADIRWHHAQCITLTMPSGTTPAQVTYGYDGDASSTTFGAFYRVEGDETSTQARRTLVRSVDADFAFNRYKLQPASGVEAPAVNDLETKLVQVTFHSTRASTATAGATQQATSSRFILRNKRAGN